MKKYLGIDLGGTNVRVAKINTEGEIEQVVKGPSYGLESADKIINNLFSLIRLIDNLDEVVGIGLGVPGPVDQKKGWMNMASNIPSLGKYPLVHVIEEEFNIPVAMDNDANVACLAEAYFGAGKDKDAVVYVTHSTGIGCGICINRQTISGAHGFAGEIGNIIVNREGDKINHLNRGAIEIEASGTNIVRKAKERIDENIEHAGQVFNLAFKEDNKIALKIIDDMTTDFAIALANVAHVFDPDVFVIGGGVTKSKDYYFESLIDKFKSMVHEGMKETEFQVAQLEEPGLIGAAMLPRSKGE